ncbi:MAG: TonB-dependent receptor, partial [Proteobacteria bacterium]|nr:TonB-dependent receptor [Pseudomonadota bacterium]
AVKLTPFLSFVDNYIDAVRRTGWASVQFNYLGLANQDARLYGIDLSGFAALGTVDGVGRFTLRGLVGYVHGRNADTGEPLYNVMPLNARLSLEHRSGNWTNTVEQELVSSKDKVSGVRNERETGGYGLTHLRSSYTLKSVRLDFGIENLFDKHYELPLGGAYIGQGTTMSLNGASAPYGYSVPGMGRSVYVGANLKF